MAVVIFDADVLIGFLNGTDAHHAAAVQRIHQALASGDRRVISAVTYAEVIVGPYKAGAAHVERVDVMLQRFGIDVVAADRATARAAAELMARTRIGLPDAFVLAIAGRERSEGADVRIESFDERVLKIAASEVE